MKKNKEKNNAVFAFLGHPRNYREIGKKYFILKFLPKFFVHLVTRYASPVIVSRITGIKSAEGRDISGFLIILPYTAEQMLKNHDIAKKKVLQAVKFAERLNIKIIGLGALTSSVTNGGLDLYKEDLKIGITTGNSLTAGITILAFKKIVKLKNIDIKKTTIAVVGATGSIGSFLSKYLVNIGAKNIILIGKTKEHLEELENELNIISKKYNSKSKYTVLNYIEKIKDASIVIVATSAKGVIIKKDYLSKNAIVYDITQPQNISKNILKERPDITVIDGGLVRIPNLNINFDVKLPIETAFACLTETILLAAEGKFDNFSLGKVKLEKVEEIMEYFNKYDFSLNEFTSFGKKINL